MTEPRLVGPIVGSFIALVCFFLGRYVFPEEWQSARVFFILVGGLALLWAVFGWADWLAFRFNYHLSAARQAWVAPTLALAREVNAMDRDKIRLFERIGPFESIGYIGNTGMRWMLYTPMGNIPYTWIADYLDKCEPAYPRFIPQHGMPDNLQRDYVRWFTGLMVQNNLAEKSVGNRPARWKIPIDQVYERLGLSDE
jgi:hypothetical protein